MSSLLHPWHGQDLPEGKKLKHNQWTECVEVECTDFGDGDVWVLTIPDGDGVEGLGFSSSAEAYAWAERNILPRDE